MYLGSRVSPKSDLPPRLPKHQRVLRFVFKAGHNAQCCAILLPVHGPGFRDRVQAGLGRKAKVDGRTKKRSQPARAFGPGKL